MPDQLHRTYHDEEIVNLETHHEESDVNVRALLWFVVIFIVFAAVTHGLLFAMFKFFVNLERGNANAPLTSMARPSDMDVPQLPRLQPFPTNNIPPFSATPVVDMVDMRAHEDAVLNNYGWVDQPKGVVHIPIAEAKKQALQSGIYKTAAAQQPSNPTTEPPTPQPRNPTTPQP